MSDDFGKKQIFMGSGDYTLAYMGYLHQQLEQAFILLGGIQQPDHGDHGDEDGDEDWDSPAQTREGWYPEDDERNLNRIAGEIHMALTGEKPNLSSQPVSTQEEPPETEEIEDTEEDDFLLTPVQEMPEDQISSRPNRLERAFALGCVVFAILMLVLMMVFSGCSGPSTPPTLLTIEGQLVDVEMCQEDSYHSSVLLEFEDGRVQKARLHYKSTIVFYLNSYNEITMDSGGSILSVEKTEGISD